MLIATERAKVTRARLTMAAEIPDADMALRLSHAVAAETGAGQFGSRADRVHRRDQVVEESGRRILLVAGGLADALSDATIDTEPGQGDALVINRCDNSRPGEERPW